MTFTAFIRPYSATWYAWQDCDEGVLVGIVFHRGPDRSYATWGALTPKQVRAAEAHPDIELEVVTETAA